MKQFTLFKASKENYPLVIDVFKMLVGNAFNIKEDNDYLLIIHNEFN